MTICSHTLVRAFGKTIPIRRHSVPSCLRYQIHSYELLKLLEKSTVQFIDYNYDVNGHIDVDVVWENGDKVNYYMTPSSWLILCHDIDYKCSDERQTVDWQQEGF